MGLLVAQKENIAESEVWSSLRQHREATYNHESVIRCKCFATVCFLFLSPCNWTVPFSSSFVGHFQNLFDTVRHRTFHKDTVNECYFSKSKFDSNRLRHRTKPAASGCQLVRKHGSPKPVWTPSGTQQNKLVHALNGSEGTTCSVVFLRNVIFATTVQNSFVHRGNKDIFMRAFNNCLSDCSVVAQVPRKKHKQIKNDITAIFSQRKRRRFTMASDVENHISDEKLGQVDKVVHHCQKYTSWPFCKNCSAVL